MQQTQQRGRYRHMSEESKSPAYEVGLESLISFLPETEFLA
jgi:hypothetical protein